jgi:hypothetical protein
MCSTYCFSGVTTVNAISPQLSGVTTVNAISPQFSGVATVNAISPQFSGVTTVNAISPQCCYTSAVCLVIVFCCDSQRNCVREVSVVCLRTLVFTCLEALRSIACTGLSTIRGGVSIVRDTQELVCRCCSYWFQNCNLNNLWKCSIMKLSFT